MFFKKNLQVKSSHGARLACEGPWGTRRAKQTAPTHIFAETLAVWSKSRFRRSSWPTGPRQPHRARLSFGHILGRQSWAEDDVFWFGSLLKKDCKRFLAGGLIAFPDRIGSPESLSISGRARANSQEGDTDGDGDGGPRNLGVTPATAREWREGSLPGPFSPGSESAGAIPWALGADFPGGGCKINVYPAENNLPMVEEMIEPRRLQYPQSHVRLKRSSPLPSDTAEDIRGPNLLECLELRPQFWWGLTIRKDDRM